MKSNRNGLLANYIYNLISQSLQILLPFITAPYLARVLRETGNGQIAFANSVVAYFVAFAGFGFSLYGQREIAKYKDNPVQIDNLFSELLALRAIFSVISLASLIVFILTPAIPQNYKHLVLINSLQVISVIFDIQFFYQGIENFKSIAIRTIAVRLTSIICVFLFVKSQNDVWIYLLYSSLIGLIANIIMWPQALKIVKIQRIKISGLIRHLSPSLFIFLPILSGTIFNVLDSTMIGYLAVSPEYENGCYGSAIKIVNLVSTIVMADGQVLASRNARDFAIGNFESLERHIRIGFRYIWIVGFPIMAGIFLLSNRISFWFFGEGFIIVPTLLRIFTLRVITHGVMNVIGNQYLLPSGREKVCTIINFTGIAANIILNACFIPQYGSVGAATASIIGECLLVALYLWYFIKEHRFWNITIISQSFNYIISTAIMGIAVYILNSKLSNSLINLFFIISSGALIYAVILFLLKDELAYTFVKKIKAKLIR